MHASNTKLHPVVLTSQVNPRLTLNPQTLGRLVGAVLHLWSACFWRWLCVAAGPTIPVGLTELRKDNQQRALNGGHFYNGRAFLASISVWCTLSQ
jgi:hypothetical protein